MVRFSIYNKDNKDEVQDYLSIYCSAFAISFLRPYFINDMLNYLAVNKIGLPSNTNSDNVDEKIVTTYIKEYGNNMSYEDLIIRLDEINKYINDGTFNLDVINMLIILKILYEKKYSINNIKPYIYKIRDIMIDSFFSVEINKDDKMYQNRIKVLDKILFRCLESDNSNIPIEDLVNISIRSYQNLLLHLISYIKYQDLSFDMVNGLTVETICSVNENIIDRLYENIKRVCLNINDKLGCNCKIKNALIKMCSLLGIDNTQQIIIHMIEGGKKDNFDLEDLLNSLLNSFGCVNLKCVVCDENGEIIYNQGFIKILMSNIKDSNGTLLSLLKRGSTILSNIENLYRNFRELYERYREQNLRITPFLEEYFSESKVVLNPDMYRLEGNVIGNYFTNSKHRYKKPFEIVEEIKDIYIKMRHGYQKTIPYVSGKCKGVVYETLKANDPLIFELGSDCDCCLRVSGEAEDFFRYCILNPNGRVIVFKDEMTGKILGMTPMVRNGRLLLCNSIESSDGSKENIMALFEALKEATSKIIDETKGEGATSLISALISNYKPHNQGIIDSCSSSVVAQCDYDYNLTVPLEPINDNMGIYDYSMYPIAGKMENVLEGLKVFEPQTLYDDPRNQVVETTNPTDEDKRRVQAIYYELYKERFNYNISKLIYNDDWFIIITEDDIISEVINRDNSEYYDPRAQEEYDSYIIHKEKRL